MVRMGFCGSYDLTSHTKKMKTKKMYPLHPDSSVRLRVAGVINKDQNTKNKRITQHLSASGMSGSLHTIKE
jgi:hypothetical protein